MILRISKNIRRDARSTRSLDYARSYTLSIDACLWLIEAGFCFRRFAGVTFRLIDESFARESNANRWTIVWFGSIASERASGIGFTMTPWIKEQGSLAGARQRENQLCRLKNVDFPFLSTSSLASRFFFFFFFLSRKSGENARWKEKEK